MIESIGIDPGAAGGIAQIGACGLATWPLPWIEKHGLNGPWMRDWLWAAKAMAHVHVFLEELGQRRGEGAVSGKTAATQWGRIQGMIEMAGIPYTIVRPQKWRPVMGCNIPPGGKPNERTKLLKSRSIVRAAQVWPDHNFKRTEKCKGPSDGMCEAALIAEYGRRQLAATGAGNA